MVGMHDPETIFESDSINRLLLKMSIPATIGMIVNALYNLVDTIFVGRGVGAMGIAGLTIALPVQMIIGAVGITLGSGAASVISRRLGEKRQDDAARTAVTAFTLSFLFSFFIFAAGEIFIDPMLRIFGATESILPHARSYMRIILIGAYFLSSSMVGNNITRAEGQPKIAMLTMIIGAGMNIILDPIFIFALKMGIQGAALATIISQFFSYLFVMRFLLTGKSHLPLKLRYLKPKGSLVSEILLLGLPTFIRQAGMSLLALVINNVLKHYGGDLGIASYGMLNRLFMFTLMPIFGIVHGYQPIAGYSYGARRLDRLEEVNKKAMQITSFMSLIGFLFLEGGARILISVFTKDNALIAMAVPALRIASLCIWLLGFQVIGSTYFLSIGKALPAFMLGLSRQFFFLIPLVIFLPRFFQLRGVWIAMPAADLLSTSVTLIWFLHSWKNLKKGE